MLDVIIIGSGPFSISLAAHAVSNKLKYKLFGYPMEKHRGNNSVMEGERNERIFSNNYA